MNKATIGTLTTCTRKLSSLAKEDFFGIASVTSKDISGAFASGTRLPKNRIDEKYRPLLVGREVLENKEYSLDVTFGRLRFDADNKPRVHGQFEANNERKLYDTTAIKQAFVPDDPKQREQLVDSESANHGLEKCDLRVDDLNYREPYRIESVGAAIDFQEVIDLFRCEDKVEHVTKYANTPPMTFFFQNPIPERDNDVSGVKNEKDSKTVDCGEMKLSGYTLGDEEIEDSIVEATLTIDTKAPLVYDPSQDKLPIELMNSDSERVIEENEKELEEFDRFDSSIDAQYANIGEKPKVKGLDYLKQVRAQRIEPTAKGLRHRLQEMETPTSITQPLIKLDSKGFRNYTYQVPDWSKWRYVDVLKHIQSCIIYNNYGVLAVNKPYGIASHDESKDKERIDMNSLVQEVAKQMRIEKVYLAHRLDKTTTGVLLFATNHDSASKLNKMFKSDQIKKTYWCLTKGVPNPEHAIIDIPIGEFKVAEKMRSVLVPESFDKHKQLSKRYKEARRAITEYCVIDQQRQAALVEVKPRTGVKHQIRVHMSFALNTPVLGDHKYSHIGKIAPQKLPQQLLNQLHLRQEKVRTLPMHLHAHSIVIPGIKANGETLFINAPLPRHFVDNMKAIKLTYSRRD